MGPHRKGSDAWYGILSHIKLLNWWAGYFVEVQDTVYIGGHLQLGTAPKQVIINH
jgi:hypothetical protein